MPEQPGSFDREGQSVEREESWRDDYLRWICGFANAEGGVLVIGHNVTGEVRGQSRSMSAMQLLDAVAMSNFRTCRLMYTACRSGSRQGVRARRYT